MIDVLANVAYDFAVVLPGSLFGWAMLLDLVAERSDHGIPPVWLLFIWRVSPRSWSRLPKSQTISNGCLWIGWIAFANLGPVYMLAIAPFILFPSDPPKLAGLMLVSIAALALEARLVAPLWLPVYRSWRHPGSS